MNEDPLGFVETPAALADWLASEVLLTEWDSNDRILYPGAGCGNIAAAVHRRCSVRGYTPPEAVFVERNPDHISALEDRFVGTDATHNHGVPPASDVSRRTHQANRKPIQDAPVDTDVTIHNRDFLKDPPEGSFEFIVSNPPYTAYDQVAKEDRELYNECFETATGKYGLFAPFVEQMLDLLAPNGVLVFLAPVQWLTTSSSESLRNLIRRHYPVTPFMVPECAFPDVQVETTLNIVGRPGADWTGYTRPPSRTRLTPTTRYWDLERFFERLGVDEDDMEDTLSDYTRQREMIEKFFGHKLRSERESLDAGSVNSRQTALERWG